MDFNGIKKYLTTEMEMVRKVIADSLSSDISLIDKTNRAILAHPGKSLRPILVLLAAKACSGGTVNEDTIHYAATAELLHNATLLHDDVADACPVRHGVPNVMSILGGRASVLLGDYWLTKGVENILAANKHFDRVVMLFSKTLSDLAEGELLQLQKAEQCDTEEADYYKIIYRKTASLFEASAVSGALSADAPENKIQAVKGYARNLGIAFQIRDDMFDYIDGQDMGKPAWQDLLERKITLPLLGALSNVPEQDAKMVRQKVRQIDGHPEYKAEVVSFVLQEHGIEYASGRLSEYVNRAKDALAPLGKGTDVEMLASLADFLAVRTR